MFVSLKGETGTPAQATWIVNRTRLRTSDLTLIPRLIDSYGGSEEKRLFLRVLCDILKECKPQKACKEDILVIEVYDTHVEMQEKFVFTDGRPLFQYKRCPSYCSF